MRRLDYKWIALSVTSVGVLMSAIDGTIVVLALPTMMVDLRASLVEMIWVIMGYTLVITALLLVLGRLSDMFGRVRMYNLGFAVFTAGSFLCGLAGSGGSLIAFRIVQGIGGALLMANSLAILTEAFPAEERGRALGYNAMVWAVGGIVGPILGGLILARFAWRVIFLINVPIGVAGTFGAHRLLRENGAHRSGEPFDWPGALLFTTSLTSLLLALTQGVSRGFRSPLILGLLALALVGFAVFSAVERRVAVPVLDPLLFANRVYAAAVVVSMLQSLAVFATSFLVLYFLQGVQGEGPLTAALMLLPMPVISSLTSAWAGRVSDRIGHRLPATTGLLFQAASLVVLSRLTAGSTYPVIATALVLAGFGSGLFWPPNMSAAMGAAPPHRLGVAAGTLSTLRQAGMVTSFALSIFVAARALPHSAVNSLFLGSAVHLGAPQMSAFVVGMRSAFLLSAAICTLAALLSAVRPKPAADSRVEP